jgi:hypothetical protein
MVTREEAVLVLSKLHSDRSVAVCAGTLWGWNVLLKGRISQVSEDKVTFESLDRQASLVMRLDLEDEVFDYEEPVRGVSQRMGATCLVIGLPERFSHEQLEEGPLPAPVREKISITELREDKS